MLDLIQIFLGLALIATVILQAKGGGLGGAFGGGTNYHAKRGTEKSLFYLTILIGILFVIVSFYNSLL